MMRYSSPFGNSCEMRFISVLIALAVWIAFEPGCCSTTSTVAGERSWEP